jgi:uncharacterized protein (DUF433 family)
MEPREHSEQILNMRASGMSIEAIAEQLPVGKKYVTRALEEARLRNDPRALRAITKVKTADLVRPLAEAGMTRPEIAARLGLSISRVSTVAEEAGIAIAPIRGAQYKRDPRGWIPKWVPREFVDDYRRLTKLYGEEQAASVIRKWKAEAQAPC